MLNMNNTIHIFHVKGMHCSACELLIESELKELPEVENVKASLTKHEVAVTGNFDGASKEEIVKKLSSALEKHNYSLYLERQVEKKQWTDFKVAIPIALAFIIGFIVLQKLGIVNLVSGENVNYGTSFVIGIIASLSTCMAVVGGLVLSMSAVFAKEGDRVKPQVLFHIGRLVSFFILGGVIGAIGSAFTLNTAGTFIIGLVVALVMLILGINLLDVFHGTKKFQLSLPKSIGSSALSLTKLNHSLTPLLVGVVTFFLPCGFTQSMQLYTLSTGSFMSGALTMFAFALGTLPVLALISFSSFSIKDSKHAGIFFKTAGLIVIAFALMNLINSFVIIGLIPPVFNF